MPRGIPNKPKPTPPRGTEQAYENGPGKPIIHNGCPFCGLLDFRHTATCPRRTQ